MNFSQAIATCFKKYAVSEGRASRSEYWYWVLFTVILTLIAAVIDIFILDTHTDDLQPADLTVTLITLLPTVAVTIRRLHDVNRSGWWWLICFTIVGLIYPLLVWHVKKGTEGTNRYGADPLAGVPG